MTVRVFGSIFPGFAGKKLLDDTVFEGVETDDGEPASGEEVVDRRGEQTFDLAEFVVHENAESLKRAGGRMDPMTLRPPDRPGDRLGERDGIGPRATGHDGAGNPTGTTLFSITQNDVGDLIFCERVNDHLGGKPGSRIHTHVGRSLQAKTESARGFVELGAADAKVCEHPVHSRNTQSTEHPPDLREAGVYGSKSTLELGQARSGRRQRRRVPIQPDDSTFCGLKKGFRVTAATQRAVDEHLTGLRLQAGNYRVKQHRDVCKRHRHDALGMPVNVGAA
jgi:hypothetical protein